MDTPPCSDRIKRPTSVAPPPTAEGDFVYINPRRKYKRRGTGSVSESKGDGSSEDEAGSSMSETEEHELGALDSDVDLDFEDDEEAGLNKHARRKYLRRKRRRDGLDARIAGTSGLSKDEARQADQNVIRNLLTNASLIGGWYFFSLSISIVSPPPSTQDCSQLRFDFSITNSCFLPTTSTFISLYSQHLYTWWCNSALHQSSS
jgi:hypothetical protein